MEEMLSCQYTLGKISTALIMYIIYRRKNYKRVEELTKIEKQPTFDQYPMFDWVLGIPIVDSMT